MRLSDVAVNLTCRASKYSSTSSLFNGQVLFFNLIRSGDCQLSILVVEYAQKDRNHIRKTKRSCCVSPSFH